MLHFQYVLDVSIHIVGDEEHCVSDKEGIDEIFLWLLYFTFAMEYILLHKVQSECTCGYIQRYEVDNDYEVIVVLQMKNNATLLHMLNLRR